MWGQHLVPDGKPWPMAQVAHPVPPTVSHLGCVFHWRFDHGSKSRTPSEHPNPTTKIDWNGWCTYPKMVPLVLTHSHLNMSPSAPNQNMGSVLGVRSSPCLVRVRPCFIIRFPLPRAEQKTERAKKSERLIEARLWRTTLPRTPARSSAQRQGSKLRTSRSRSAPGAQALRRSGAQLM